MFSSIKCKTIRTQRNPLSTQRTQLLITDVELINSTKIKIDNLITQLFLRMKQREQQLTCQQMSCREPNDLYHLLL